MSWEQTHRYYAALHAIVAELEQTGGSFAWQAEYAAIFGDRAGVRLALDRYWRLMVQAQVDDLYDASGQPSADLRRLAARHRGLLTALRMRPVPVVVGEAA